MQRQRSAVSSIHDSTFHHGSASSDSSIDQERCLDSMRNSSEEQLSDCVIPSGSASRSYMNSANQEVHDLSGWSLGECSLSGAGDYVNKNIPMSVCTGTARISGDMQYESSNDLSRNNATGSLHTEQATSGHLFMQSPFVPKDRINNLQFSGSDENGDDDCQIIECGTAIGSGISNKKLHGGSRSFQHYSRASSSGGYTLEDTDGRAGSSINAKPLSRKAKTLEASASHSSGSGSSNLVPHVDRGSWQATRFPHNAGSGIPAPTGNIRKISLSGQSHPGLGLSIDEAASVVPLAISASGRGESSRRNFQMGITSSHQQDCMPGIVSSTESVGGSSNVLSAHHSLRLTSISNSLDLGPFTVADNGCLQRPMINFVRNSRSRRHRGSSSRAGNSNTHISEDRSAMPDEAPPFRNVSRDILEHPVFIPATQIETSSQNPTTWSLANGNAGVFGRVGSSSRGGSSLGANSHSSSLVPHRDSSQYPRRLSEFVRRSLITPRGTDQNNRYNPTYSGPSSSSPEQIRSSGHADQRQHRSRTRSAVLLERHLSRSLGVPYPSHSLTAASEGRNRLVSEIRNVLDLMRRGEGLRVEEVMILDQSVLFGMADLHDRHRDMRLDVDNMSYEELLALEERIGNVSTGLSEESISIRLQQRKYHSTKDQAVEDPCCICRDEYNDAETLGILECGHGFHSDCIKQWLMQKNICPICKTTGLNT